MFSRAVAALRVLRVAELRVLRVAMASRQRGNGASGVDR